MLNQAKILGTGRRKKSVCRVELIACEEGATGLIQINHKPYGDYMGNRTVLMDKVKAPLTFLKLDHEVNLDIRVYGGGLVGQADAILLALSRALIAFKPDYRVSLRQKGYLTQDARNKERKKYGLKKARKSPQFSKR